MWFFAEAPELSIVRTLGVAFVITSQYQRSQRCPDAIREEVEQVARPSRKKELMNLVGTPHRNCDSRGQQSCARAERTIQQPSEQCEYSHVSHLVPRLSEQA
jgi:hypothetical protein